MSTLTMVAVLAACAGAGTAADASATPTPRATRQATPAPTPSPTPVDPVAAFITRLEDDDLAFAGEISGAYATGETNVPVSGSYRSTGGDFEVQLVLTLPTGQEVVSEQVYVDGRNYVRSSPQPWIRDESTSESVRAAPLNQALSSGDYERVGSERIDGREGHRLAAKSASLELVLQALAIIDRTVTVVGGELETVVDDDGEPLVLRVSADIEQAGRPASWSLEYQARPVRGDVERPEDVWRYHASQRFGYRIAYPEDWDVTEEEAEGEWPAMDLLLGPVTGEVQVIQYADLPPDVPVNLWFQESVASVEQEWGPVASNEAIEVAGVPARLMTTQIDDGGHFLYMQATFLTAGMGWDINWFSRTGNEDEDRARFEAFLASFALTTAP